MFECIKDCAEYYHINYTMLSGWLRNPTKMPEIWKDRGLKYV